MKKIYGYKLIKAYPDSPSLGGVAVPYGRGFHYYNADKSCWGCSDVPLGDFPQYWKPLYSDVELPVFINERRVLIEGNKALIGSSLLSREELQACLKISNGKMSVVLEDKSIPKDTIKSLIRKLEAA